MEKIKGFFARIFGAIGNAYKGATTYLVSLATPVIDFAFGDSAAPSIKEWAMFLVAFVCLAGFITGLFYVYGLIIALATAGLTYLLAFFFTEVTASLIASIIMLVAVVAGAVYLNTKSREASRQASVDDAIAAFTKSRAA